MNGEHEPKVITRDSRGVYHWAGIVDTGYEQKTFRIVFGVCGGLCLLLILMSLFMGGDVLLVTLLSSLGVMAVCSVVCWLFSLNAGNRRQYYEMTEDFVIFCVSRRNRTFFSFRSIRKAVVFASRNMIELYPIVGSGPVFAPPEDFEFVRDFILERIPDKAEIVVES